MELTKEEFQILWTIEDGMNDLDGLYVSTELDIDVIKKILKKLEKLGLIKINIKMDNYYKEEFWTIFITEKAKSLFEKYKDWIPK